MDVSWIPSDMLGMRGVWKNWIIAIHWMMGKYPTPNASYFKRIFAHRFLEEAHGNRMPIMIGTGIWLEVMGEIGICWLGDTRRNVFHKVGRDLSCWISPFNGASDLTRLHSHSIWNENRGFAALSSSERRSYAPRLDYSSQLVTKKMTNLCGLVIFLELVTWLEQATFSLRVRCTTDCATLANIQCADIISINRAGVNWFLIQQKVKISIDKFGQMEYYTLASWNTASFGEVA